MWAGKIWGKFLRVKGLRLGTEKEDKAETEKKEGPT